MSLPLTRRRAARIGGWASLLVIAGHTLLAYVAFARGEIPIANRFVRWELVNLELCFALVVGATSILAIRHAGARSPDGRQAWVATTVLALLWTADALYAFLDPMPIPIGPAWLPGLVPLLLGALALLCWIAVLAQEA
ncbi:hypothetical protein KF840_24035 [bacterium]|nr:hypothetical protein [bacterium]